MGDREPDLVRQRYERRDNRAANLKYGPLLPHSVCFRQEKERALVRLLRRLGPLLGSPATLRVLEVGCGSGSNLIDLLRLGFRPENLIGVELLEERAREARRVLPSETEIRTGDASTFEFDHEIFHICYQSTVFTSLLDHAFQDRLARRMWNWVRPGGGVLWYDFVYDNPKNPDVKGVSVRRVRELFPLGRLSLQRVTLAPPLARRVARIHASLYTTLNVLPFLRTHILAWIAKNP